MIAEIVRRVMRPFCLVVGHDWAHPVPVRLYSTNDVTSGIFRTVCGRCDKAIVGDWDWMETNQAWKHWRRR